MGGVGTECARCLGSGIPEHFDMNAPEGIATCPTCHGSGVITPRVQYLSPLPAQAQPVNRRRR